MSSGTAISTGVPIGKTAYIGSKPRAELLAIFSIMLGAAAQLILKGAMVLLGARHAGPQPRLSLLLPAAVMLLGCGIYAIGTWFWWKAVSRASISYLYPLTAGSYAVVALGGRFMFHEQIQTGRCIGIAVITLGVALMALSNSRGSE